MLGSAAAAMLLRNLIHSALLLILSWASVAAFYLWAGAEFVAFAQILVYVGAISMVVLFAVLLTRQNQVADVVIEPASRQRATTALTVGACLAGILSAAVVASQFPAAALLIIGVILTVALIGATLLAATEAKRNPEDAP